MDSTTVEPMKAFQKRSSRLALLTVVAVQPARQVLAVRLVVVDRRLERSRVRRRGGSREGLSRCRRAHRHAVESVAIGGVEPKEENG